jgi:hypothetical protein
MVGVAAPTGGPDLDEVPAPTTGRHGRGRARVWPTLVVVALYLAAAVLGYAHVWSHPTSQLVGVGGSDPERMIWYLAWFPFAIGHLQDPFLATWANAPWGVNVLSDTSQPLLGVAAAPVTLLFGPIASFNVLLTLAFATSATAGYALARRFTTWRPAAFACGLLYGFSPYMVAQGSVGHLNLIFIPLPPLIFLVLDDLLVRQTGRPVRQGCLLGALVIAQFFISSEILAGTVVVAAGGIALLMLLNWRSVGERLHFALVGLGTAAALATVVLAYPVWFTLDGPQHIVGPIQLHPQQFRSDLVAPLVPDHLQAIAPSSLQRISAGFESGDLPENGSYLGIPLLVVAAVGTVVLWRRRIVRFTALMAVATFVLSLGSRLVVSGTPDVGGATGLRIPGAVLSVLPLLKNAQPSRFSMYVVLFVALLLALILDDLWRVLRRRAWRPPGAAPLWSAAACALVAVVALVPLLPAWPYASGDTAVPTYFTSAAVDSVPPGSTVLLYPYPAWAVDGSLPVVWQASAGIRFRTVGGYFLVPSAGTHAATYQRDTRTSEVLGSLYSQGVPELTPALRAELRAELRSWHVHTVLAVPAGVDPAGSIRFFEWLIGRPPTHSHGVDAWYDVTWT